MTPERYKQVGKLFHDALAFAPAERATFLDDQCADDTELRREVESLLASHDQSPTFIAKPAIAMAAELLVDNDADEFIGKPVGRYVVRSLLGIGGMGRVYLAEDLELGRRVALKLLLKQLTHDQTQLQRFRQEARAASALNHPNILTVHEIGQVAGTYFIATEYVDGDTLRDRLQRSPLSLPEAIEIAIQIADALSAAHAVGIVHRDIKPENVMLRRDGYVKVLDFGLAKLTEKVTALQGPASQGSTLGTVRTDSGVIMGTVNYMSPEQIRGVGVDVRTDIWSLGVLLYELVARRRPFESETQGDTIVSILHGDTTSALNQIPDTPHELQQILSKALARKTDDRYQSAEEMATDLRQLRRRIEVDSPIERTGAHLAASLTGDPVHPKTDLLEPARSTSSLEFAVNEIKRHKTGAALIVGFLLTLLAGVGFGLYKLAGRTASTAAFKNVKMTRLTAIGKVKDAAISPNGKYVVYATEDDKQQSLWVRQVATGSSVQIVPPMDVVYWGLTFSNDSDYVYYVKNEKSGGPFNNLYLVPALGGASKKLLEQVDSAVTFSPDGRRLAFVRDNLKKEETEVVLANTDGTDVKTLATRKAPDRFASDLTTRIAWSPDGKTVACAASSADAAGYYHQVIGVSVDDGSQKPLTSQRWVNVAQVTWQADGDGLVMIATAQGAGREATPGQVWHLSYPSGEARRITNDLDRYRDVSLTADASTLITVQTNRVSNIWVAPKTDLTHIRQITSGTMDGSSGLVWTPDGRILYQSEASGKPDIWVMNADGSNQRQLTQDGDRNVRPQVSPDGRYVIYASDRTGRTNVWRMDVDGGNPKQLTDGKSNSHPHFSPDGRWVVYISRDNGNATVWKVGVDNGQPIRLTDPTANLPVVSPDGKQITCFYWDEQVNPPRGVMIFPFEGGPPTRRFNISPHTDGFALSWATDGRAILYIDTRLANIWSQPVDGGEPSPLTDFQGDQVFNFDYSPDGKWLAVARGRVTDDVVLISDLK